LKKSAIQLSFPSPIKFEFMPHQLTGIEWLKEHDGCILADDPGLGKTAQALKAAEGREVIVISPPSVMNVWKDHAVLLNLPVPMIMSHGKLPKANVRVGFKGFDKKKKIRYVQPNLEVPSDAVLILDEAHAFKNYKSQRGESVQSLAMGILAKGGKVWLLTGTPMLNQPMELWQLLSIANVQWKTFGSWGNFISLFGGSKKYWGGYDFVPEAMNETEIKKCIAPYILRRTKDETLKDLPSKSHQVHKVSVPRDLHKFHPDEAVQAKSAEEIQGISEISSFRKILAMEKLKASMDLIESYEASGEPIVVFSAHLEPIESLMKREKWCGITGETTNQKRETAVKEFQAGYKVGFAGTISAAGVGITLNRAFHAFFIDKVWTPAINRQAEDRLHRIGQKNAVVIHHIVSDHMLDYHIDRVLGYKSEMIDRIF